MSEIPEVETEERWVIVWPNGSVYATNTSEANANDSLKALTNVLAGYTVPMEYWPAIRRRRRTITKSAWEDI